MEFEKSFIIDARNNIKLAAIFAILE